MLLQFGPLGESTAFLVDGYVSGGTAITADRRTFPKQFLNYHRAGHGAATSPQTQRGYTAFVHTRISRIIGASGIHVGTMRFGKMEGDASDKCSAYMLQDDEAGSVAGEVSLLNPGGTTKDDLNLPSVVLTGDATEDAKKLVDDDLVAGEVSLKKRERERKAVLRVVQITAEVRKKFEGG